MRFDVALVKFLIRLDQLWRSKESKVPKIDRRSPQISGKSFWSTSKDLKLLQCYLYLIHFHDLHHAPFYKISSQ